MNGKWCIQLRPWGLKDKYIMLKDNSKICLGNPKKEDKVWWQAKLLAKGDDDAIHKLKCMMHMDDSETDGDTFNLYFEDGEVISKKGHKKCALISYKLKE